MSRVSTVLSLSLLSVSVLALMGCMAPRLNLSQPLCFVADGPPARAALFGTNMWAKHIPGFPHPKFNDSTCKNPPIYVTEDTNLCSYAKIRIGYRKYRIFLREASYAWLATAHELGHGFGIWKHIEKRLSIMSWDANSDPTPEDLNTLCRHHPELKCPKFEWCKGTFYDAARCPSKTPEEGMELWRKKNEKSVYGLESKPRVRLLQSPREGRSPYSYYGYPLRGASCGTR